MEETNRSGRIFLSSRAYWAFWGVCTGLVSIVFDRLIDHHSESPLRMLFDVAGFVAVGVLIGPVMSKPLAQLSRVRLALLVGAILIFACILWRMATGR
jgi:hypothetical protein